MDELLPEEQHRAGPHRQRRRVGEGEEPLRDPEVVPRRAVVDQVAPVAAGDDLEAAVLDRRVGDRDPAGEDRRRVGLLHQDAEILVPRHLPRQVVRAGAGGSRPLGQLHPDVLHRVGDDLRPDQRLDPVEQPGARDHVEDRIAEMERRVGGDVLLRQADVEALGDAPAALLRDGDQALREREPVVRRSRSRPPRRDRPRPARAPRSIPRRAARSRPPDRTRPRRRRIRRRRSARPAVSARRAGIRSPAPRPGPTASASSAACGGGRGGRPSGRSLNQSTKASSCLTASS